MAGELNERADGRTTECRQLVATTRDEAPPAARRPGQSLWAALTLRAS